MSVRCIDQVFDRSAHAGTELLMLVVLADYSDDDGNSYPSVASLARKCRMSPRNANYILNALQKSGELRVLKNEGPRGTNRYRIVLSALGQPLKPAAPLKGSSPLKPTSSTPEAGFPKPLKPTSDEPSLNRQEPSGSETGVSDAGASQAMSAKERVWVLGPAVVGEKGRALLGKLVKEHGEELVAEVLAQAHQQLPIQDGRAWLTAACIAAGKRKGKSPLLADSKPRWALDAGYENRFEAENDGCFAHNASAFSGGKRKGAR